MQPQGGGGQLGAGTAVAAGGFAAPGVAVDWPEVGALVEGPAGEGSELGAGDPAALDGAVGDASALGTGDPAAFDCALALGPSATTPDATAQATVSAAALR